MKTLAPPSKKNGRPKSFDQLTALVEKRAKSRNHLPDDLAANHDFYLHGLHKRQPRRGRWIPSGKAVRRPTPGQVATFNRKMDRLAAELEGVPPDLAKNLDHYLHGHPKK